MGKKKILVCSHWLELGGAENALLGLLEQLAQIDEYQVDLFLCRHSGPLMQYIPKEINLLPEDPNAASVAVSARSAVQNRAYGVVFGRIWGKYQAKRWKKKNPGDANVAVEYSHRYTWRYVKPINPDIVYDAVLSFLAPHYIAACRTRGKQKIAWVHTDYQTMSIDSDTERCVWEKFDQIVGVSQQCVNSFVKAIPSASDRVMELENIMPINMIRKIIGPVHPEEMDKSYIRILSVGRYAYAKNFDNVPDICKRIVGTGLNVKWYIIGYGGDEALIKQKIQEAGMEDRVILLGKKDNPYPYIAACDLYVQPSRYEGKCVAVREAQMLGKTVVITRYATSASQLEDGVDGVIVPMDNEGCAQGIAALLRDPERMQKLAETCRQRDYTNGQEVEKLSKLLED